MLHRLLALAVLVFAACGATRHSLDRPADDIAVVKGAKRALAVVDTGLEVIGLDSTILICTVDGRDLKQLRGYPEIVEVLPGHRTLGIRYSFVINGKVGTDGDATLAFDAVAGRTYQITAGFDSVRQPTFFIEEETAR